MAMQVDRMDVVACIPHAQPIALPLLQVECRRLGVVVHGKSDTVDRPAIETFFCGVVFLKEHVEGFIGRGRCATWLRKSGITPLERGWSNPLGFAGVSGVFDDDAHAVMAI